MAWRRATWAFVLGSLVACGGVTYGGLGDDPIDDAGGDDAGADAIFGVDDGASDDASDSATVDSTIVDTGVDASDASDTADSGDSADAPDSADASETSDSNVGDVADAIDSTVDDGADAADTMTSDTASGDTFVDDAADATDAADSTASDTGVADSAPTDTGVADSAPTDTGADAGPLQTNPNQVYCTNGSGAVNLLCASGQDCCGALQWNGSWDYSCGSGCGFGQRSFACNEKADCGGKWCCASNKPFSSDINGSSCSSSACGSQTLCMLASDCPSGKTCVAQTVIDSGGAITIGVCQ